MKKTKSRKFVVLLSIFVLIFALLIFFYIKNKNKKLETEKNMPYNFENINPSEATDFSDFLTNYAKTSGKTPIYDNYDFSKKNGEIEKGKYLEVYGYKDGISKIKFNEKFYYVDSKNIENVSKDKKFKVIKGILLVNTEYELPSDFNPQMDKFVEKQFELMKVDANRDKITLDLYKGFISYEEQKEFHKNAPKSDRDVVYAMYTIAGHNESQIGQSLDIIGKDEEKNLTEEFKNTEEFKWLMKNAHKYGFILRYPENQEDKTNFRFEPWHFRYVGVDNANKILKNKLTLEEFLRLND
ncbi:D-alanyl-D-alanine carboxypeptidase family protein [Parvimonas sp. G1967]|uniref:M15 family metallopeptidase n=1 Tax=Parvimonas sp. G1967 TaxID=3387695 RepID=UPI0039E29284